MKKSGFKKCSTIILSTLLISVCLLGGCKNAPEDEVDTSKDVSGTYTIEVVTEGGLALENIEVQVYTDTTLSDLVAIVQNEGDGKFSFESEDSIGDIVVLNGVPLGYKVAEHYVIEEMDTKIVLEAEMLSMDDVAGTTFAVGDAFADLSVEATDGKVYTISELLKSKKAVVLNFWYINCGPCKAEFPFLQEAYETYKEDIEVIALNPVDGTKETVAAFKEELALAFPMAACDPMWEKAMKLTAYPTTIVIDRYGTIAFMHKGSVTETETFNQIFEYFTSDDYKQVAIRNLKDLK